MFGLPEILFGMALLLALAVPPLWPAVPAVLVGYVLLREAEDVSNGVRDTSAPGSVPALIVGVATIAGAGVVALLILAIALGGTL